MPIACPYCNHSLRPAFVLSEANRLRGRLGGRKKVLKPCPKCGAKFGARELREHLSRCGA